MVDDITSIWISCHSSSISKDLGSQSELPPLERYSLPHLAKVGFGIGIAQTPLYSV